MLSIQAAPLSQVPWHEHCSVTRFLRQNRETFWLLKKECVLTYIQPQKNSQAQPQLNVNQISTQIEAYFALISISRVVWLPTNGWNWDSGTLDHILSLREVLRSRKRTTHPPNHPHQATLILPLQNSLRSSICLKTFSRWMQNYFRLLQNYLKRHLQNLLKLKDFSRLLQHYLRLIQGYLKTG